MIKSINGLELPASKNSTAEYLPITVSKRAVDGTLITKWSYEKWRLTYQIPEGAVMDLAYQAQIYATCLGAQLSAVPVVFVSPYDGQEHTVQARCTEIGTPDISVMLANNPAGYGAVSFTFEEI